MSNSPPVPEDFTPKGGLENPEQSGAHSPSGFGRLAKKISSRTTDLIAAALVIFAALGMGRHVIRWWSVDPAARHDFSQNETGLDLGADGRPLTLEFGDYPVSLERSSLSGSQQDMADKLIDELRRRAETSPVPKTELQDNEREMLQDLKSRTPVFQTGDGLRIDHVDGPLNLFVATHGPPPASVLADPDRALMEQSRVVCWALAFPTGPDAWTAYLFAPEREKSKSATSLLWTAFLPPGARRTVQIASRDGDAVLAFEGTGSADAWQQSILQRFRDRGFAQRGTWRTAGQRTLGIFHGRRGEAEYRISVGVTKLADNRLTGLLQVQAALQKGQR